MKGQNAISPKVCHICQKIVKASRSFSCNCCKKTYCFPCIASYFPNKAQQILPQTETNNTIKISQCFFCLKQCICDKCKVKGSILDLPFTTANNSSSVSLQKEEEINPQMGLFKGKKFSQMPTFMQRAYLKKKAIYFKHQISKPIIKVCPIIDEQDESKLEGNMDCQIMEPINEIANGFRLNSDNNQQRSQRFQRQSEATTKQLPFTNINIAYSSYRQPSKAIDQEDQHKNDKIMCVQRIQQEMIANEQQSAQMQQQFQKNDGQISGNINQSAQSLLSAEKKLPQRINSNRNQETIAIHRETLLKRQIFGLKMNKQHEEWENSISQ